MKTMQMFAMLLCVACAAQQVHTLDDTNKLRLCGRALYRAVVFTCGGSRWKRLMEEDTLQHGTMETYMHQGTNVPEMDRRWRDQKEALTVECCQKGCQRSDLYLLC